MLSQINTSDMIDKTIEYCVSQLGMREMTIDDIGEEKEGVVRLDNLYEYVFDACGTGAHTFDGVTWEEGYDFLRDQKRPEYVLDHLVILGYIRKRETGVVSDYYEHELSETLASLCKKYGGEQVKGLKARLRIKTLMPSGDV